MALAYQSDLPGLNDVGLHKCVVTKQTFVYYLFDEKTIKIAAIFDNRLDSDKLIKEIE